MSPQVHRRLHVRDVFAIDRTLAVVVPEDAPFEDVVKRFAKRADLRGIFVVDSAKRLVGVITRQDLLHWAANRLGVADPDRHAWRDLYRVMTAATAKAACRPRSHLAAVHPSDDLEVAFHRMLENELIDIPVVDGEGRILGDIRLTEILAKVFEQAES